MHHPYSPTRRFRLGVCRSKPQAENRNNSTSVLRRDFHFIFTFRACVYAAQRLLGADASDGVLAYPFHVFCSWKTPEPTPLIPSEEGTHVSKLLVLADHDPDARVADLNFGLFWWLIAYRSR